MTAEAQRLAIAQACGWTDIDVQGEYCFGTEAAKSELDARQFMMELPHYCSDLNAMHEAEKVIGSRWPTYCETLLAIVEPEPRSLEVCHYWNLLHATAAQRAEAFLRTLNLWSQDV
jgi:hypothetical protein